MKKITSIFFILFTFRLYSASFTGNELSEDNSSLSTTDTNKKVFTMKPKFFMWKKKGLAGNNFKIGYVDIEKVFASLAEKKIQSSKLEEKKEKYQNDIKAKENEIANLEKDYDKNADLWTAEIRMSRRLVIEKKWQDLQNLFDKYRTDLLATEQALKAPIFERIREAVGEIGEKMKFDIILNSNESVIWGKKIYDITDNVIQKVRISSQKEKSTIK